MGQKIVLSGVTFTDTTLAKLRDDTLLSAGSLFLFDPGHSLGSFAGVPDVGVAIPNVAWKEAAALLGSGTQGSLAGAVATRSADSSIWKAERSAKGGVHGIITQGGTQAANLSWTFGLPAAVRDYVRANLPGRSFYFSTWRKLTRPTISNAAQQSHFHCANNTSNYLFHFQGGVFNPNSGTSLVARAQLPGNDQDSALVAGTNRFTAGAVSNVTGTGVTAGTAITCGLGTFDAWGTVNFNKAPSQILYRVYLEDLTASGRDFATVSALDQALYNAAFASGGKFFGDTYTNPSTVP